MVHDFDRRSFSHPGPVYSCFNFRMTSELPLDELAPAGPEDARPLVEVRRKDLPEYLPGAERAGWNLQVAGCDALLTVPEVGRFMISSGRQILVDPLQGTSRRQIQLFLLGSALGVLAHQRGLLPLHANAIVADGGAHAFCGYSGAGKSTLAAHFERAGFELLCDDVCPVALDAQERPVAWPGIPRLKLWSDAARMMGHDPAKLDRVSETLEKFHVPISAPRSDPRPVPLRRLYVLHRTLEGCEGRIVRLTGKDAMAALAANTYRGLYLEPLGLGARHFRQCAAVLRTLRVYSAPRTWGFEVFEREAKRLEQHVIEGADE